MCDYIGLFVYIEVWVGSGPLGSSYVGLVRWH